MQHRRPPPPRRAAQSSLCSCRRFLRVTDLRQSVPQMPKPAGMPSDFKAICNDMERPASDEPCAYIPADRCKSAHVELTKAFQSPLSERCLTDLSARLVGE